MSRTSDQRHDEERQASYIRARLVLLTTLVKAAINEYYECTCFNVEGERIGDAADVADAAHDMVDKWLAEMKKGQK